MGRRRLSLAALVTLIALVTLVALVTGSAARAAPAPTPTPSPANAGIAVYVETIPTGGGRRAVGVGSEQTTPLPAATKTRLARSGGADAKLLEQVATAASYGAPQKQKQTKPQPKPKTTSRKTLPTKKPSDRTERVASAPVVPAAPEPDSGASDLLRWWLLAGGMGFSGVAVAVWRPNRRRPSA